MKGIGELTRSIFGMTIIVVILFGMIPIQKTVDGEVVQLVLDRPTHFLSDDSQMNVTELWDKAWNAVSKNNVVSYTKILSTNYANRTWSLEFMNASSALLGAWTWANTTLKHSTNEEIVFHPVTAFQHLLAIKRGVVVGPRPVLVISGTIDSGYSPGANDAAVSTAAVLEMARVLNNYTFTFDIYFLLLNGRHSDPEINYGARAFIEWLDENNINTFMTLDFDRLLYHRSDVVYGTMVSLRTNTELGSYQRTEWFVDLIKRASLTESSGNIQQLHGLEVIRRTYAYEMWRAGRPAVHISQGFYVDSHSNSEDDTWDNSDWNFDKATSAIAATACAVVYVGALGDGSPASFYASRTLQPTNSSSFGFILTLTGYVNTSITWNGNTTLQAQMYDMDTSEIVYQRTEDDGLITMKYLAKKVGSYGVVVTNVGSNTTWVKMNTTIINDCDGDTLTDHFELTHGTNIYLVDSDLDGLSDDLEFKIGSDPNNGDSDNDGALDLDEYTWGASLTSNDTDSDGILDGYEASIGTDPTDPDTDSDGINDYDEVFVYNTNPLSSDTDLDGLEDAFEIESGLNPLSPDTDNDSLSDLFEVLNQLNPLSSDTDGDGWSDAYEVEFCMSPTSPDTDNDGIPDGIDWDPQEHWVSMVAPIVLITIIMLMVIFSAMKYDLYRKTK